jgi:hypothetical protein
MDPSWSSSCRTAASTAREMEPILQRVAEMLESKEEIGYKLHKFISRLVKSPKAGGATSALMEPSGISRQCPPSAQHEATTLRSVKTK